MDYELGVWTLCAQEERARRLAGGSSESRDVSAETFIDETTRTADGWPSMSG